jgi:hypothetical protein
MAATYAFVPSTAQSDRSGYLEMGAGRVLVGTLSASGTYTAGGDTFPVGKTPEDFLKRIGAGVVLAVILPSGPGAEWDAVAKKLKLYASAVAAPLTEVTAATSVAALNGKPILIIGL